MIRKLQYKFIAISGISVLIIMAVLLFMINGMFYGYLLYDSFKALEYIAENDGELSKDTSMSITHKHGNRIINLRYQLMYFSVWIDDQENIIKNTNLSHAEWLSEEEAVQMAYEALSEGNDKGIIRGDKASNCYLITDRGEDRLIVFLDCTQDFETVRNLRRFSLWFSLICLAVFLIIVSALSRRVIQPVIRNMESQKQFITNAGHELKTPLAIISANTEVLEMMEGENEWTKSIMNQVQRLDKLVKNLIILARMGETEAGEIKEVDFSALVEAAADDFATVADQKGLRMEKEIEAGLMVKGAKDHLSELINILCDNAVKYCDEEGLIKLGLGKRPYHRGILFEVSNSYAGGDQLDCSRLFERFYRGDTSHSSEKTGYGIGLAMAEGFVEECKGKIAASYKEGMITISVIIP